MRVNPFWIFALCFVLAAPAAAEFYKYTDQEGNVRFTDDLNQIPESLRSGATAYEQVESRPEESPAAKTPAGTEATKASSREASALEQTRQALEEKKKQLEAEYQALMEKRAALEKSRDQRKTRSQALEYNKAVTQLNEAIQAYEKRREAFDAEVKAYNQRWKADLKRRLEKAEGASEQAP